MKSILAAVLLLCSSTCFAQMFKCSDGAGKIEYSDKPCVADGGALNLMPSSGGFDAQPQRSRYSSRSEGSDADCRFVAYKYGDSRGKELARNAKEECLSNKTGRGERSTEQTRMYQEHRLSEVTRRSHKQSYNCRVSGTRSIRCN